MIICKCLIRRVVFFLVDDLIGFRSKTNESSFGLKDRYTENLDIKLELVEHVLSGIIIWFNGRKEKLIDDDSIRKEKLAAKPFKFRTRHGRYLGIGFDLVARHLILHFNGVDVSTLPVPELSLDIHRNKLEDKTIAGQR